MEVFQDLQTKENNPEVDFSSQWMAMCSQKAYRRSSNEAGEQSPTLRVAQPDGTKVTFKELKDMRMGREDAVSFLLSLEHQFFVCWQELNFCI